MPKYAYRCADCGAMYEIIHDMGPIPDDLSACEMCLKGGTLKQVPAQFMAQIKQKNVEALLGDKKAGSLTKDFIEDARKDLEEQREEYMKEYYPNV